MRRLSSFPLAALLALASLTGETRLAYAASDCSQQCTAYKNSKSAVDDQLCEQLEQIKQSPSASSQMEVPRHCQKDLRQKWAQVGPLCDSWELKQSASKKSGRAVPIYTAAAAICFLACIPSPFQGAVETACKATGGAAVLADLASTFMLIKDGQQFMNVWDGILSVSGTAAGLATAAAVGTKSTLLLKVGAPPACVVGGILTGIAAIKWKSRKGFDSSAEKDCKHVRDLLPPEMVLAFSTESGPKEGSISDFKGSSALPGSDAGGSFSGSASSASYPGLDFSDARSNFPGSRFQASKFESAVLDQLENKEQIPQLLQKVTGMTLEDLAQRLEKEGPGSILAGFSHLSPSMKQGLAGLDHGNYSMGGSALEGTTTEAKDLLASHERGAASPSGGVAGSAAKSAGAGGSGANAGAGSSNPFLGSGGIGSGSTGTRAPEELHFEASRKPALSSVGDIWHEGFSGTIFQIVSGRIDQSRDKIIDMEWQSPLNRALSGLPRQKKR